MTEVVPVGCLPTVITSGGHPDGRGAVRRTPQCDHRQAPGSTALSRLARQVTLRDMRP